MIQQYPILSAYRVVTYNSPNIANRVFISVIARCRIEFDESVTHALDVFLVHCLFVVLPFGRFNLFRPVPDVNEFRILTARTARVTNANGQSPQTDCNDEALRLVFDQRTHVVTIELFSSRQELKLHDEYQSLDFAAEALDQVYYGFCGAARS
jgi:hypothetical protein